MTDDHARAVRSLAAARSLLVLTGAGISAESGIPTYRGPGGLYERDPSLTTLLTAESLRTEPRAVWERVDKGRARVLRARPNRAHEILASWEREGRFERFLIATQNVDGLHRAAGSDRISELHGSLWEIAAPRPREYADDDAFSDQSRAFLAGEAREDLLRRWSRENDRDVWENRDVPFDRIPPSDRPGARPNVLLFGEPYGNRLLWVEDTLRRGVDAVLVVGCSGGVNILGRLLARTRKSNPDCTVVNVNPHEDPVRGEHVHMARPATEALEVLDRTLR